MSYLSKFGPRIKADILELYSRGYTLGTIAKMCDVSLRMLQYWIKKHNLRPLLDKAREDSAKECIEVGLRRLASGAQEEISTETYIYNRRIQRVVEKNGVIIEEEAVIPVTKTVTKKLKPPETKAIEVLARKYYKDFDPKAEERDVMNKVLDGFTMRELQEARKDNPIDVLGYIEVKGVEVAGEVDELSVEND